MERRACSECKRSSEQLGDCTSRTTFQITSRTHDEPTRNPRYIRLNSLLETMCDPLATVAAARSRRFPSCDRYLSPYHASGDDEMSQLATYGYETVPSVVSLADVHVSKQGYVFDTKVSHKMMRLYREGHHFDVEEENTAGNRNVITRTTLCLPVCANRTNCSRRGRNADGKNGANGSFSSVSENSSASKLTISRDRAYELRRTRESGGTIASARGLTRYVLPHGGAAALLMTYESSAESRSHGRPSSVLPFPEVLAFHDRRGGASRTPVNSLSNRQYHTSACSFAPLSHHCTFLLPAVRANVMSIL